MNRIHRITSTTTVLELVGEIYDVLLPGSSEYDTSKLDGAAEALRYHNPTLPADTGDVTPGAVPWVWTPKLPRVRFRVPAYPGSLRTELAGIGVRSVETLIRVPLEWLVDQLGEESPTALERLRNIARLSRLSGLDPETAAFLHDHPEHPLPTPAALATASPVLVRNLVEEHVTAGFPDALSAAEPWNIWQHHAKRMQKAPRQRRGAEAPVPYPATKAKDMARKWRATSEQDDRTGAGRGSANALAWVYELQSIWLEMNEAVRNGRDARALARFEEMQSALGAEAKARGLIDAGSPEVAGPSMETLLSLMGLLLDALEPDDVINTRREMGLLDSAIADGDGILGFGFSDLQSGAAETLSTALRTHPAHALGDRGLRTLSNQLRERRVGTLPSALTLSLTTANTSSRALDLGPSDAASWKQNLRAIGADVLQDDEPDAWAAALGASNLREMRAWVGNALDDEGVPPVASDVLQSGVVSQFGATLTGSMTPFDRFVGFTLPGGTRRYVPVNDNFAQRFRIDVLKPLVDGLDDDNWELAATDLADPSRFLFVFGMAYARHIPLSLGRSAGRAGQHARSRAAFGLALTSSEKYDSAMLRTYVESLADGLVAFESGEVATPSPEALEALLASLNAEADAAYKASDYETAHAAYNSALSIAESLGVLDVNTEFDIGAFGTGFDEMLEDVASTADTSGGRSRYPAMTWRNELGAGLFDHVAVWQAAPRSGTVRGETARTLAREDYVAKNKPHFFESGCVTNALDTDADLDEADLSDVSSGATMRYGGNFGKQDTTITDDGTLVRLNVYRSDGVLEQVTHTLAYLAQLDAGLNWLGLDADTTPVWRYEVLLEKARYYCSKADEIQQRALSLLSQAEDAQAEEAGAAMAALNADQQVAVAVAAVAVADAQLEAADLAVQAAANQVERTRDDEAWAWVSTAGAVLGAVASAQTPGRAVAAAVGAAASGAASINAAQDAAAAADDGYDMAEAAKETAVATVAVAIAQEAAARLVATQAKDYSELISNQQTNYENLYALHALITQVSSAYLSMATRMAWLAERAFAWESRQLSTFIGMDYSASGGTDAGSFASSWSGGARLLADLDTLEHARVMATTERYQLLKLTISMAEVAPSQLAMLQQQGVCVVGVTQRWLDERMPGLYLHAVRRIEVEFDGLLPASGITAVLSASNNAGVRVPATGEYVADWEMVSEDWCYSADDAFDYTGTNPLMKPLFCIKPQLSAGFTQVLSDYRAAKDGGVLTPPSNSLDTFEHLSPTVLWTLEIPVPGNSFDRSALVDVRLVVYFSAIYSPDLAERQRFLWGFERVERAVMLAATAVASDSFAAFTAVPEDRAFRDLRLLRFVLDSTLLPANLRDRTLQNLHVVFSDSGRTPLTFRLRSDARAIGASATIAYSDPAEATDGSAYSAVGEAELDPDETGYLSFTDRLGEVHLLREVRYGDHPELDAYVEVLDAEIGAPDILGTWTLKLLPEDNPNLRLKDDDGDLVEVVSGQVTATGVGAGAVNALLTYTGGSWRHAAVTARVQIAGKAKVHVRLRDNGSGDFVAAILDLDWGGVSINEGETVLAWSHGGFVAEDEWVEVRVEVVDTAVRLYLDGALTLSATTTELGAGSVSLRCSVDSSDTGSAIISDVRVTQLRYDGTERSDVVSESFADGLDNWTNSGWTWSATTHNLLDLSAIQDVYLKLDYTASYAFSDDT